MAKRTARKGTPKVDVSGDEQQEHQPAWKRICARTRAAQAEIARFIKGIKFDGRLPVIVKGPPRRPPIEAPVIDEPVTPIPMAPPVLLLPSMAKPKVAKPPPRASRKRGPQRCGECDELGHNKRKHVGEPRCVHGLPWKSCPTCKVKIVGVAVGSAASATIAP